MSDGLSGINRRAFLKAMGAAGALALGSGVLGCVGSSLNDNPSIRPTGNIMYTVTGKTQAKFAEFLPLPSTVMPSLKDYSVDVSKLTGLDKLGVSDAGKSALAKNFFYLTPSTDAQVYDVYKSLSEAGLPAFVTTDSVLHTYHILFDYILRMLEVQHFSPDVIGLSS